MEVKFVPFLILITHTNLIYCEIEGATRALSDAILMANIHEISLVADFPSDRVEALIKALSTANSARSLTLKNAQQQRQQQQLSALNVLITKLDDSFGELFSQNSSAQEKFFLLIFIGESGAEKRQEERMSKVFNELWKFHIYNVNVITLGEEELCKADIKMFTFMPFSTLDCRSVHPIEINSFYCSNFSWRSTEIFPQKFRNLFDCPVNVSTFPYPPSTIFDTASGQLSGNDIELLNGLSKMLNFELAIEMRMEAGAWGQIFENGTATGVMKQVMEGQADLAIGTYYLTLTRAKFMSFIHYSNIDIILTIPRALPLTSIEKLFSPFTADAWIALIVLPLSVGFCVVSLMQKLKFERLQLQSSPHMNLLNIVLNGSQHFVPRQTPLKIILISFVTFCLIVRTLYQAGMFKFLQSDQRHADLQTIDELIEKGFDVWMYESFQELSSGLKIHQRRKIVGDNKTIEYYQMQTLNPHFKGAVVGPSTEIVYANQINHKNFTFRVLSEIIFALPVAMYQPKNHFLGKEIKRCVGELHSAGLIDYWQKLYLNDFYMNLDAGDNTPKVLSFKHLSGIFYVWIGGCCVSFVVFCFELGHKRILIVMKNLRLRRERKNERKKKRVAFEARREEEMNFRHYLM